MLLKASSQTCLSPMFGCLSWLKTPQNLGAAKVLLKTLSLSCLSPMFGYLSQWLKIPGNLEASKLLSLAYLPPMLGCLSWLKVPRSLKAGGVLLKKLTNDC